MERDDQDLNECRLPPVSKHNSWVFNTLQTQMNNPEMGDEEEGGSSHIVELDDTPPSFEVTRNEYNDAAVNVKVTYPETDFGGRYLHDHCRELLKSFKGKLTTYLARFNPRVSVLPWTHVTDKGDFDGEQIPYTKRVLGTIQFGRQYARSTSRKATRRSKCPSAPSLSLVVKPQAASARCSRCAQ